MASPYAELPSKIFGLTCTQYRKEKLHAILSLGKGRCPKSSSKLVMLQKLVAVEIQSTQPVRAAITLWLKSGEGPAALAQAVERARRSTNPQRRPRFHNAVDRQAQAVDPPPNTQPVPVLTEPAPLGRSCCVCLETCEAEAFPKQKITNACSHMPTVCITCLTQSLDSQIQDKAWDQISCPQCPELLPFEAVKEFASREAFERYDRQSVTSVFRHIPNFTMCLRPNCDSGQIHIDGDDQPIMTCNICQFKTCFIHKMPWHAGQTCGEYDIALSQRRMTENEAATAQLLTKTTKICPNPGCGIHIVKNGGCDHMTCDKCQFQFCWLCLAPYDNIRVQGNTAHSKSCAHHTSRLNE